VTAHNLDPALDAWSRRKWLALAVFAATCAAAATVAVSLPNLYRASATVLVEHRQVSEAFVRPSVTAELETRLQTIREDVMSRTRLADLIRRLNLYPELRDTVPIEALVARMRGEIELELKGVESQMSGRSSTISFTIGYGGRDPGTVARVANELARMYVQQNTNIREGQAAGTAEFLKAQLAGVRKELDAYERRANDFRLSHLGELPQQVETNLASLERLNTQLRLNGENQIRLMDRRERLERQRVETAAVAPVQTPPSPDEERLAKLKRDLDDLRRRFTDEYPDVARAREQVAALEQQIARHPVSGRPAAAASVDSGAQVADALADIRAELQSLKEEERMLRQTIAGYEQRVENVPKRQQEFQQLSRDYETTKERYDTLLKRYEEAQLAESLEQGQKVEQFRILDPALPPREPVAPNRIRMIALGFVLALGLALGAVVAAEKLDTAFHAIDELRAFVSVPTLASVPRLQSRAARRRRRRVAALAMLSAVVGLTLIVAGSRYLARGNEQMVRMMERSRG
jgi:protein tyrosine kinase modulator